MRQLMVLILVIFFLGCFGLASATPHELGNHPTIIKDNSHVGMNPGTPDGRQGGETIEDAVVISALPFMDTGNTTGNINDYDEACPYSGSTAPDVVYSFVPAEDLTLKVDLCSSGYDTKTYIYDADLNLIACNDDFYSGDPCGQYVSLIEAAHLVAGITYYIIVDGYGGDSGDYILNVERVIGFLPCILSCDGFLESEPALEPGYIDSYNSGCGNDGEPVFQDLVGDENGELLFCGKSGWYSPDGAPGYWDTDWFTLVMGSTGMIEWTMDAEEVTYAFLLSPQDCATVAVEDQMTVGSCWPVTMTIQGNPGDLVWVWVGPEADTPPPWFVGYEYNYVGSFVGLDQGPVATDSISFDGIKSLYR